MTALPYVARMRQILHDFETPTSKGLFWQDDELVLCLNIAQYSILNTALRNGTVHILDKLLKIIPVNFGDNLPVDYCQALTAKVKILMKNATGGTEEHFMQARLYEQGEAYNYITTNHNKLLIIEEKVYPYNRETQSQALFTYIKYPSKITLDTNDAEFGLSSFPEDVYRNIITILAIAIAGYKEFSNSRDTKYYKKLVDYISSLGQDHLPYMQDIENVMPKEMKPTKESDNDK